ncbi:YdcF family protein [Rhodobacteraceae bacterium]|nr:YdcF family protein [Paracoccaceae bacterium]
MTFIRWIVAIAVLAIWSALIGTALYVALYDAPEDAPNGAAIVILGGGANVDGTGLGGETQDRLNAGLELYKSGAATLMVVTGGGTPAVAEIMRDAALAAGVAPDALLMENQSHSTLQNALFTADFERIDKSAPVILVTNRYHLPRANASFRWAGFGDVINHAADPDTDFKFSEGLLWEAIKWPYNALRAAAASAANAGNVPRESYIKYLE